MTRLLRPIFCLIVWLFSALFGSSAYCGTLSLISVSDSVFASVEGISNSVSAVSKSASKATNLAEGEYRVEDVADLHDADMRVRLTLRPVTKQNSGVDSGEGIYLYMRGDQVARAGVRVGHVLSEKARPYGVAVFARNDSELLAIVLNADMSPQIGAVPVTI